MPRNQTLTIKLHNLANRCSDKSVEYLCEELNESKTKYPGTNLQLIYQLLTSKSDSTKNETLTTKIEPEIDSCLSTAESNEIVNETSVGEAIKTSKDRVKTAEQLEFEFSSLS
jgi:hypothetical protein